MTAPILKNRAGVATATTGTGTVTLGAALAAATAVNAASWRTFANAGVANGNVVRYLILDSNGAWETGTGIYTTTGTTLSRTLLASSTGALLSLSGTAQVFIAAVAEDIIPFDSVTDNVDTAVHITDTTVSTSPTTGALTVAGGVGILGNGVPGSLYVNTDAFINAGFFAVGIGALQIGIPAKATAGANSGFQIVSNTSDSPNQLKAQVGVTTSATAANRRLTIGIIEDLIAWRNVTICESGGNVGIGGISVPTEALHVGANIIANGFIGSYSPTGAVGYTVGAGGTVTQATSRTTAVTLNTVTGAITLFAGAPTVGTWVSFTVNDSAVLATDIVCVSFKSATNTYIGHVSAVAAGSFRISFTSIVGTSSDSPVINFAIIRGSAT